jgi:DNA-binding MarR family transcriptional regulator
VLRDLCWRLNGFFATTCVDPYWWTSGSLAQREAQFMERDGFLVRRADLHDHRSVTLWLSAKGRTRDRPSAEAAESAVQRMLGQVRQRDLLSTARVMEQLSLELESLLESGK